MIDTSARGVFCLFLLVAACGTRSELYPASAGGAAGSDGGITVDASSGVVCTFVTDCPFVSTPCLASTCEAGACVALPLARGTRLGAPAAACHVTVCDGAGNVIAALDPSNVPSSANPCSIGVCEADGTPTFLPIGAGTACASAAGGRVCDGLGACVQCLTAGMCGAGQACVQHTCVSPSCTNKVRDGDESDVDCGGSCPACAVGLRCSSRRDCASATCDPAARRCVPDPCHDGVRDGDETDIDCGNSCAPCGDGRRCKVDLDCASDDCDPAQLVCLPATCIDQTKDASETGVDCGGGTCPPCVPGQGCLVDADCTVGCDLATHLCSGNVCADHRRNGLESDVDCGGAVCAPCTVGKTCNSNGDCAPGHLCNASKVCQ